MLKSEGAIRARYAKQLEAVGQREVDGLMTPLEANNERGRLANAMVAELTAAGHMAPPRDARQELRDLGPVKAEGTLADRLADLQRRMSLLEEIVGARPEEVS